ncbi:arginine--tRNA ligase [Patescibacteria group bacterium]|nr:arginine--tRNA ligase [Patescibacteria group bacterium]
MPIMCFALNDIYGDIHLDIDGKKIFYHDQGSILTNKWNSEQLERGSLNKETVDVVMIIENLGILQEEELKVKTHELAVMIQRYCGGAEFEEDIIRAPRKEKDLGVLGLAELEGIKDIQEPVSNDDEAKMNAAVKEVLNNVDVESKVEMSVDEKPEVELPEESPIQIEDFKHEPIDRNSLKSRIKVLLKEACEKAYPHADISTLSIDYPRDPGMGDYACSIALKLSKQLVKEPMLIAEKIVSNIEAVQFIGEASVMTPGFINIKIARSWLENKLQDLAGEKELYDNTLGSSESIVIDYSSPNVAKPLGVHHLLSTVIGQTIYNIYKSLGFKAIGVNHLGDWGTQFGMLIYAYKTWGNKKLVEKNPIPELLKLYVKFNEEVEKDAAMADKGREEFKKLEEGDEENTKLWEWFKELSIADLKKTYATLGISFDEYIGESFYRDKMDAIVQKGLEKGVFKEGEGGSVIAEFTDENMAPCVIKKSDGATLYATRDLATLDYRMKRWMPSQVLYVVDTAQNLHFKQVFDIAQRMGLTGNAKLHHISFGRMRLPDRSMSTRKGNVVLLEDLLKDALEKSIEIVDEKSKDLDKKQRAEVAKKIAIGAIKYNILSQNRTTDITFDWDKMLSIEGNSAPYLQYTYARCASILRKYDEANLGDKNNKKGKKKEELTEDPNEDLQTTLFDALEKVDGYDDGMKPFDHPKEQMVARLLVKFQEYLVLAAEEYRPNLFTNYLYELAREFNSFYTTLSVLQAETKHVKLARINITKVVAKALKEGLGIIGIEAPEKM